MADVKILSLSQYLFEEMAVKIKNLARVHN